MELVQVKSVAHSTATLVLVTEIHMGPLVGSVDVCKAHTNKH